MNITELAEAATKLAGEVEADELGDWYRAGYDAEIVMALREYASNRTGKKSSPGDHDEV